MCALLCVVSFSYALPWIALGGLLSYFKEHKSDAYYVMVYAAYYAPGLPVALLQTRFDAAYDAKHTSRVALLFRGMVCWTATLALIPILRFTLLVPLLCVPAVVVLGVATWSLHGSCSQIASLVTRGSGVVAQQVGFALPG